MTTKLNDPTPPSEIKTRQGPGGRTLDYIDARFVMDRLDAAVGPNNWQDKYEDRVDGSVRCGIGIRQADGWVWKWDVGDPSDIEAVKGAHSDAFKRAAVKWGIARDLYGDHAATTKAAPRPAERPRTAPAPDEPSWDGIETIGAAQEVFADLLVDESKCPDHDKPFKSGAKGWFCPTPVEKDGDRVSKWCQRRPSKAWQAAQELVPA